MVGSPTKTLKCLHYGGWKFLKIIIKSLSSLIPPFLVEDRMTFWIWTFLKYHKCPNLISSKKCFLTALKNLEENPGMFSALKTLQKTKSLDYILKNIFGIFKTFFGHFYILAQWLGSISLLSRAKKFQCFLLHRCSIGHF